MKNVCVTAGIFLVLLMGCKINSPNATFFSGDFIPPKLLLVENISSTELLLSFSKAVSPSTIRTGLMGEHSFEAQFSPEKSESVTIQLTKPQEIGKMHSLYGEVVDHNGNTLSFITEFAGFNNRVPRLILSEVRTEYSTSNTKAGKKYNIEFIELYAQSAGNLAGVTVYNSYDGEEARYYFPECEIQEGDYIVLHLRKLEEGAVDEINSKDESKGVDASPNAWDFWVDGSEAMLPKNAVILVSERKNGNLLDALLIVDSKYDEWNKDSHAEAAQIAFAGGAWLGGWEPIHAVKSEYTTVTRTLSRQGDLQKAGVASKDDWIVVATSNATPGKENSSKKYEPQP